MESTGIKTIDIGEVTRQTGIRPSALRYYEEKGLITPVFRKGLRRQYDSSVIHQLQMIALGQQSGFSLEELKALFTPTGKIAIDRQLLQTRTADIQQQIQQLQQTAAMLQHMIDCPYDNHLQCPSFLKLLQQATAAEA